MAEKEQRLDVSLPSGCVVASANAAHHAARRASNSEWADGLARLGFCARGVVYIVVGLIAGADMALEPTTARHSRKKACVISTCRRPACAAPGSASRR